MFKIALIDDEEQELEFFRKQLTTNSDFICTATAVTIQHFISKYKKKNFDYIFLDIHLSQWSSIWSIPELRAQFPKAEIIMYTVDEDFDSLFNSIKKGASGYFIKTRSEAEFMFNMDILANGGAIISPKIARKFINFFKQQEGIDQKESIQLTDREVLMLNLLAKGWTYKYIAQELDLTIDGVRSRIKRMYKKMGVNSRQEALRMYYAY